MPAGTSTAELQSAGHRYEPGDFSRFFKHNTGMSFRHFLADVRVGQACQQLADPEQSISDVASASGFNDLSTFHRVFRKLRSVTHSEYRRQIVELVSPP